jgi:hypothetical protein
MSINTIYHELLFLAEPKKILSINRHFAALQLTISGYYFPNLQRDAAGNLYPDIDCLYNSKVDP